MYLFIYLLNNSNGLMGFLLYRVHSTPNKQNKKMLKSPLSSLS